MKDQPLQGPQQCPHCQMGIMQIDRQPFLTWINGDLLAIPDFPLWECIVCGYREYDLATLIWLQRVFDTHAPENESYNMVGTRHKPVVHQPISFYSLH